jgi:hypothetical protein
MKTNKMTIAILGCICIFLIASLVQFPAQQAKAETLNGSSLFFRIYLAYSVNQKAVQAWLPDPWKAASLTKGPFKGANLFVFFTDVFTYQDGEGKIDRGGTFYYVGLVGYGKNSQTGEFAPFVIRVYWPFDDSGIYKTGVKATVSRKATIKGVTSKPVTGSEVWKVQDNAGGIMEFRMDYQRDVPKRVKREMKVRSIVEPDFFRIYREDYSNDLVKSIPAGINKVKKYQFRSTISKLGKMFDGSEQLVGISINPCRVRQAYLP